jgi:hypothetical protein
VLPKAAVSRISIKGVPAIGRDAYAYQLVAYK